MLKSISIDRTSSLPYWVQIKDQLKIAYSVGRLSEGDVVPSIRALAARLGVGTAVVRRAYDHLTRSGFLSTEPRRYLVVTDSLKKPARVVTLARECTVECERFIDWARKTGVSPVSLSRLFLRQAAESERSRPAYVYVDLTRVAAEHFAARISETWELPVEAMTIAEVARLSHDELNGIVGILVDQTRQERLVSALHGDASRVFPVRMKFSPRLVRRIRRRPSGSSVLLILPQEDAIRVGEAMVASLEKEVVESVRLQTATLDDIPDLAAEAQDERYRLVVISRHLWDDISERARRLSNVTLNDDLLVMESLEESRVASGVLV